MAIRQYIPTKKVEEFKYLPLAGFDFESLVTGKKSSGENSVLDKFLAANDIKLTDNYLILLNNVALKTNVEFTDLPASFDDFKFFKALNHEYCKHAVTIDLTHDLTIVNLNDNSDLNYLNNSRLNINVPTNTEVSITEYQGFIADNTAANNSFININLSRGAICTHKIKQFGANGCINITETDVNIAADATYNAYIAANDNGINRYSSNINLNAANASANIKTLQQVSNSTVHDINLNLNHNKPHCNSHTINRAVVKDKATGSFSGKINVAVNASKTNADLESKFLLLSSQGTANNRPLLEIYNDDVKCSHGATIGVLDEAALLYMRARGINETDAKAMLIESFLSEAMD